MDQVWTRLEKKVDKSKRKKYDNTFLQYRRTCNDDDGVKILFAYL